MIVFRFLKWVFNFHDHKKRLLNIILISFLVFFGVTRLYSLYIVHPIYIFGFHIHHFYYGMLFLSFGGIFGVLSRKERLLEIASIFIGGGVGMFADEIGLLLNCTTPNRECVYAFPNTFDIIMFMTSIIILAIIFTGLMENYYANKEKIENENDDREEPRSGV